MVISACHVPILTGAPAILFENFMDFLNRYRWTPRYSIKTGHDRFPFNLLKFIISPHATHNNSSCKDVVKVTYKQTILDKNSKLYEDDCLPAVAQCSLVEVHRLSEVLTASIIRAANFRIEIYICIYTHYW
jgi:hypothetical protein